MNQLPIAVPQGRPLGAVDHAVVGKEGVQVPDRVLEDLARTERFISVRIDALGEHQVAENCFGIGRDNAFEFGFDGEGNSGRGRDGWRVGNGRRQRDRRCEGDRRCQGNRGGLRDCRRQGSRRRRREVAVSDRLREVIQKQGQ